MGNKGENITGNNFLNIGVSGGKGSQSTIKEKLSSKMEKSIYVGQWDSIKEKMIWQEREKGDEVAGIPKLVNSNSHVEEFFTLAKPTNEEGPNKEKRAHKSSGKKTKVSQGRLPQVGGSKVSLHMDTLEGKKEALELSGKRKKHGGILEEDRDGGKRNKCNVEELKIWSDDSAEAVDQPRQPL
jgi:hypothetical protein